MARPANQLDRLMAKRPIAGPFPQIVLMLATFIAAGLVAWASTGGKKWQGVALVTMVSGAAFAAWLDVQRRFMQFATWLMAFLAPMAIDVEIWHRVGAQIIVSEWPASYTLSCRDLLLYLMFANWGLELLQRRAVALRELKWVGIWSAIFLVAGIISFPQSPDPTSSFIEWSRTFHYVLVFVYLSKRIDDRKLLHWLFVATALHIWIEVLISTLQYTFKSTLGLEFLGERPDLKTFDTPEGADPRAGGLMGHPNNLALYFVLTGPIMFSQFLQSGIATRWRVFWGATFLALNFGLLITFSRAGWLCAASTGLMVYHWFNRRAGRPRIISIGLPVVSGICLFVALFALWDGFRYRITAPDYGATATRWQQFSTALNVILHKWWCGTGLGAYVQGAYEFNAGEGEYRNLLFRVHNGSLLVTAELGLIGGVAYHAWYWIVMRHSWRLFKLKDDQLWAAAIGCFCGLLGWFVKSQYNVHTPIADESLWQVAGLTYVIANCAARERDAKLPLGPAD